LTDWSTASPEKREKILAYNREYYKRLPLEKKKDLRERAKKTPDYRAKQTARCLNWVRNNPEKVLLNAMRQRARKMSLPFNLELGDILIPRLCPVLGIEIVRNTGGVKFNSPSVDRIIPSLGYTKGNIIIVSHKANMIKSNATPDEILKVGEFYKNLEKIRGE